MEPMEAIRQRRSVRRYRDTPLPEEVRDKLRAFIDVCNRESGLHIQLICNEPAGFGRTFPGAANYLAVVGRPGSGLEERSGYYGEKVVLFARQLGLSSCWAMLSRARRARAYTLEEGERFVIGIALGYGEEPTEARKSKALEAVTKLSGPAPEWFQRGVEAALLAPTAMNQQAFVLELREDGSVKARAKPGPFAHIDLGIVKCHFEIGAGTENFRWAD